MSDHDRLLVEHPQEDDQPNRLQRTRRFATKGQNVRRSPSSPRLFPRIVALASTLVLAAGCTIAGAADPSPGLRDDSPPDSAGIAPTRPLASTAGLPEEDAVAAARKFLSDKDHDAAVWETMAGSFSDVEPRLAHDAEGLDEPLPDNAAGDRSVWGIEFKVSLDICAPSGSACEQRDGLRSIIIDRVTGDWLITTTYAPPPGYPLPTS
jgi:hypothetical protein